jgi:hypothetical protein
MNIYVVTEGICEKKIYISWIPLVNHTLSNVGKLQEIKNDNFIIYSGDGYPQYFEMIDCAIADVNNLGNIDRLVICIDSEEMSYKQKYDEILEHVKSKKCIAEIKIVIQFFCFETWALGNRKIMPHNPKAEIVKKYKGYFDVSDNDPELLPEYPSENLNRAQFSEKYLRKLLNAKGHFTYNKGNPKYLKHHVFYEEVKKRYLETKHIKSFKFFLEAFSCLD